MDFRGAYENFIRSYFRHCVIAMIILSAIIFIFYFENRYNASHAIYSICAGFSVGFIVLGLPSFFFRRNTKISRLHIISITFLVSLLISFLIWHTHSINPTPNEFITGFVDIIVFARLTPTPYTVALGVIVLQFVVQIVTYGIMEVYYILFGDDYHRVLLSLQKKKNSKLKQRASFMFQVPDIIDVDEVTIEPPATLVFNISFFLSFYKRVLFVSFIVCSYLFLNPVFLRTFSQEEVVVVQFILSIFATALVVPVYITYQLRAKALSKNNRPYDLAEGLRKTIFKTSYYLLLFLTLLWVCLYTGEDLQRILISYAGYFAFIIFASLLSTIIFINSFTNDINDKIYNRFTDEKERMSRVKDDEN